ncbi:hypothetical protein Pelo_17706 [Pelomyxa schiedti]|nr:hypothetical protein Pelo_17706 [Pelomyxa schiedti]
MARFFLYWHSDWAEFLTLTLTTSPHTMYKPKSKIDFRQKKKDRHEQEHSEAHQRIQAEPDLAKRKKHMQHRSKHARTFKLAQARSSWQQQQFSTFTMSKEASIANGSIYLEQFMFILFIQDSCKPDAQGDHPDQSLQ